MGRWAALVPFRVGFGCEFRQHGVRLGAKRAAGVKRAQGQAVEAERRVLDHDATQFGVILLCRASRACMLGSFITSSSVRTGAQATLVAIRVVNTSSLVRVEVQALTMASISSIAATRVFRDRNRGSSDSSGRHITAVSARQ